MSSNLFSLRCLTRVFVFSTEETGAAVTVGDMPVPGVGGGCRDIACCGGGGWEAGLAWSLPPLSSESVRPLICSDLAVASSPYSSLS